MNEAQGAAATGEAEGTTPPTTTADAAPQTGAERVVTQPETQDKGIPEPTRLGALLEGMGLPPEVLATVAPKGEEQKPEKAEPAAAEPEPEPEPEPQAEPEAEPEAPLPAAAEGPNGEEDHVPEEWPQSAKARVQQEAEKRRRWKATAEQLQTQLNQAKQGVPVVTAVSPQDPLANVLDLATLAQVERDWQEIQDFAEDNPDGAYDVLTGKDADGNEIRRDYSADDIKDMKRKARPILRAVPTRREYLAELQNRAVEAQHSYGEMFKDGTDLNVEASQLIGIFPELRRTPDWMLWLGDAITGRRMRLAKAGKGPSGKKLSPTAQAILEAPKVKPAPSAIKARSHEGGPQGGDVDLKQAREELAARDYSGDAMTDYITKLRLSQNRGIGPAKKTLA